MTNEVFLTTISILISLFRNIVTVPNAIPCDKVDLIQFIEFASDCKRCLQIAIEKDDEATCVLKSLELNLIFFKMTSIQSLRHRNISSETGERCETFLIFAENLANAGEIFEDRHNPSTKQFFPYSKFYFYIFDQFNRSNSRDIATVVQLKSFLIENALFGYVFEFEDQKVLIRDILTNDLKKSKVSYIPSDLLHPIVDTNLAKDNFRISLFNTLPFVFYKENGSYNTKVNEIDGTEIRFVKEIIKNWKKTYNFRDFSQTKVVPYEILANDIVNGSADLAMGSIWLLEKNYEIYDFTKFYEGMCATFMVPKPSQLHGATAIYAGISTKVWLSFLFAFLLSSISLNFFSKMEIRLHRTDDQYTDFATSFMETISIVTSQSLHRFSTSDKVSAQTVLTSWILFSMWMDVCYTTIYTSRITSPSFEKPIDTVKQFLDQDMFVCSRYASNDSFDELNVSVNEDDRKLSTRSLVYGDNQLYRQRLIAERKCGVFAFPISNKYVSVLDDFQDLVPIFRLMRNCFGMHYSAFAFRKYSPYTKLFDWHIRRYQEHGILKKWYSDMARDRRVILFDDVRPEEKSFHQITVVGLSGSFLLLCCGLLLSLQSLLVEIIIERWRASKRRRQNDENKI